MLFKEKVDNKILFVILEAEIQHSTNKLELWLHNPKTPSPG